MSDAEVLPGRHPVLEIAEFDTELVVYDPRVHKVHHVKDLAALVLDACNGATTRAALVEELADGLGAAQAEVEEVVDSVLEALAGQGLLEGTKPPEDPPPCLGCGGEAHVHERRFRWLRGGARR